MRNRLLVVDRDPRSLRVLDVTLRSAGFEVDTATSGEDAWAMLESAAPDLIIADTELGGIDGFELCARLRQNPLGAAIPFIFLAADKALDQRIRALEVGANDYLVKPAYVNEVVARVRALLQRRDRERLTSGPDGTETPGGHAGQGGPIGPAGRVVRDRFVGSLADITVVDLVQVVEGNGRSGIAHLRGTNGAPASIYFRHGNVVDAEVGRLSGIDALSRLFSWQGGSFEVEWKSIRRKDLIERSSAELVIEGMQRFDEWNRLLEQLPDVNAVFEVDYRLLAERLAEIPDEVNSILRLCDGVRTIMQVVEDCAIPDIEALTAMIRLREERIVYDLSSGQVPERTPDSARFGGWLGSGSSPFPSGPPSHGPTERIGIGSGPVQQSFADRLQVEAEARGDGPPAGAEVTLSEGDVEPEGGARRRRTAPGLGQSSPDLPSVEQAIPEPRSGPGEGNVIRFPAPRDSRPEGSGSTRLAPAIPASEDPASGSPGVEDPASQDAPAPINPPTAAPASTSPPLSLGLTLPLGLASEIVGAPTETSTAGDPSVPAAARPPAPPAIMTQTHRGFGPRPSATEAGGDLGVPGQVPDRGSGRVEQSGKLAPQGSAAAPSTPTEATSGPVRESARDPAAPADRSGSHADRSGSHADRSGSHAVARGADSTVRVSFPDDAISRRDALDELGLPTRWRGLRFLVGALVVGTLAAVGVHRFRSRNPKSDTATHGPKPAKRGDERSVVAPVVVASRGPVVIPSTASAPVALPGTPGADARKGAMAVDVPAPVAAQGAHGAGAPRGEPAAASPVAAKGAPVAGAPARPGAEVTHPAPQPASSVAAPPRARTESAAPVAADPTRLLSDCRAAFSRNRLREAATACTAAIEASPNSADALTMLAHTELNRGRLTRANQLAQKAVAIDPNLADAYVIIGGVHQDSGQKRDAKTAYRRYLQLAPKGRYADELRSIVNSL